MMDIRVTLYVEYRFPVVLMYSKQNPKLNMRKISV